MNGIPPSTVTPGLRTITGQAPTVRAELDKLAANNPDKTLVFTGQNLGTDGEGVECVHVVVKLVPKLNIAQK